MIQTLGLLSLILTATNIYTVQFVNGDEALIKQVCDGTPSPDACEVCLKGFPGTDKDLAYKSLLCSTDMNVIVDRDFADISKGSDDSAVKEKCASCQITIGNEALECLTNAVSLFDEDRFSDAADLVAVAIDKWAECSNLIQDLPVPATFAQHFTSLKNLYMDTHDIIAKL